MSSVSLEFSSHLGKDEHEGSVLKSLVDVYWKCVIFYLSLLAQIRFMNQISTTADVKLVFFRKTRQMGINQSVAL